MIFYESFYEAIKNLPDAQRLQCYDAIIAYGVDGVEPGNLDAIPQVVYTMAKPLIEANRERKANGAKGGRPRKDAKPINRNKFINFTPSDTDWGAVTNQIEEAQRRKKG